MAKTYTEKQGAEILNGAALGLPDLLSIIGDLWERAEGTKSVGKGVQTLDRKFLWPRTRWRRNHFHNLPEADPVMKPPYHEAQVIQSDAPRRIHKDLKARMVENHVILGVDPHPATAAISKNANDFEQVLNGGLLLLEERENISIQGALADGQIISYAGWLHWSMASHIWPKVPELEELDDLPDADDEKTYTVGKDKTPRPRYEDRMAQCPDCGGSGATDWGQMPSNASDNSCATCKGTGMAVPEGEKRYKETDGSLQDRRRGQQARAGFPWFVECPAPDTVFAVEDRSLENGFGLVMRVQRTKLLTYAAKLAADADKLILSCEQMNNKLRLYGEQDSQFGATEQPNFAGRGGEDVTIIQLWTRDECYELACMGQEVAAITGEGWTPVKYFTHPYGMPPFAIAPAVEINDPDPVLRYEPALEGVYRKKVDYDRIMTLASAMAEMIALPFFYLFDANKDSPLVDEAGNMTVLTRDAMTSMKLPPGIEIRKLEYELNPAFMQLVEAMGVALKDAEPNSGIAEITATTQPWTARLAQSQASVEPKLYVGNQTKAIAIMVKNWAMVMSLPAEEGGFGETVWVYAWDKESGKVDRSTVVGVDPQDIKSLDISATINNTSDQEAITLAEHGRQLLADPNVMMTPLEFIEDYEHKPNPEAVLANRMAFQAFKEFIYPGLIKQELARVQGSQVVLGPDFQFVGPDGKDMASADVLSRSPEGRKVLEEWTRQQQAMGMVDGSSGGAAGGPTGQPGAPPPPMQGTQVQATMPGQGSLAAPGTVPIPGATG